MGISKSVRATFIILVLMFGSGQLKTQIWSAGPVAYSLEWLWNRSYFPHPCLVEKLQGVSGNSGFL